MISLHCARTPCDYVATEIRHTECPPRKGGFSIAVIMSATKADRNEV